MSNSPTQAAMEAAKRYLKATRPELDLSYAHTLLDLTASEFDRAIASATAAKDARIRELEEALKPFGEIKVHESHKSEWGIAVRIVEGSSPPCGPAQFTIADLRHAAQALKATP